MQVRCRQKRGRCASGKHAQTRRSRPRRHLCCRGCADDVRRRCALYGTSTTVVCRAVVVECALQCRTLTHMAQSSEAPRMLRRARSVRSTKRGGRCCMSRRCCRTAMSHTLQRRCGRAPPRPCRAALALWATRNQEHACARACAHTRVRVPSQELTAGLDSQSTTCSSATDSLCAAVGWESPPTVG